MDSYDLFTHILDMNCFGSLYDQIGNIFFIVRYGNERTHSTSLLQYRLFVMPRSVQNLKKIG